MQLVNNVNFYEKKTIFWSCDCWCPVALPHGAVGSSEECNCGIYCAWT